LFHWFDILALFVFIIGILFWKRKEIKSLKLLNWTGILSSISSPTNLLYFIVCRFWLGEMAFSYCHWATATGQFSRCPTTVLFPRGPSNTKLHARGTAKQKTRKETQGDDGGSRGSLCVGSFALWFCFVHWNLCSNFMKRTCFPAASLRLLGPKNTCVFQCEWKRERTLAY